MAALSPCVNCNSDHIRGNKMKGNKEKINKLIDTDTESDDETADEKANSMAKKILKPKNKRSGMELDSSGEEHKDWHGAIVDADNANGEARKAAEKIRWLCLNDPSKRVSKDLTEKIMEAVNDLTSIISDLNTRNTYLKGVMEGMATERESFGERIDTLANQRTTQITYAQATKTTTPKIPAITGRPKGIPQVAQVAIIRSPEGADKTEGDELKQEIMRLMNPTREKIKIKGVRKTRDGGLVIETATSEDLRKIEEHNTLKEKGYRIIKAGASNPRIVVFYIPKSLSECEITETIYNQNEDLFVGISKEEFESNFQPRFRMGRRAEEVTNWVVEVSPKIRSVIRADDKQRLYVGWMSCKIQDFRGVSRCFNCQMYGHVAKFCRITEKTCSYCAKTGHIANECPDAKAKKEPTCPACKKAKKKADHSGGDKKCPAYKAALDRVISRTNYGTK